MTYPTPTLNKNIGPLMTASSVGFAGAFVTIISYIIHVHYGLGLPDEVEKSMMTIVESVFAFGAHRLTSN